MSKISIIEDDITISQMYRMKLESDGLEVLTSADGIEGVENSKKTQSDLILLDLMMPKMNGVEALKEIRKIPGYEKVPVIVLTNMGVEEKPIELEQLNINGYIVKASTTPREVVSNVRKVLADPAHKIDGVVIHQ